MASDGEKTYSQSFNAEDADLVLISSDSVPFAVHRKGLGGGSEVFKSMFETCGAPSAGQRPQIDLTESSAVLEKLLPYVYPGIVPPLVLDFPDSWNLLVVADKYEIDRALEAIAAAFALRMASESPPEPEHDYQAFVFASHHQMDLKTTAAKRLIDEDPSEEDVLSWTAPIEPLFPAQEPSMLLRLLRMRRNRAHAVRDRLGLEYSERIERLSGGDKTAQHVARVWHMWEDSRKCHSLSTLRSFADQSKVHLSVAAAAAPGEAGPLYEGRRLLHKLVQ
ncbi:hypothetical protein BCR35DRAFT_353678, partial [Leucosporidium creatinivorum]